MGVWLILGVSIAAAVAVWHLPAPLALPALAVIAIWAFRSLGEQRRLIPRGPDGWRFDENGWRLRVGGQWRGLTRGVWVLAHPGCLCLQGRDADGRFHRLLAFADAMDRQTYRRLRVRLTISLAPNPGTGRGGPG